MTIHAIVKLYVHKPIGWSIYRQCIPWTIHTPTIPCILVSCNNVLPIRPVPVQLTSSIYVNAIDLIFNPDYQNEVRIPVAIMSYLGLFDSACFQKTYLHVCASIKLHLVSIWFTESHSLVYIHRDINNVEMELLAVTICATFLVVVSGIPYKRTYGNLLININSNTNQVSNIDQNGVVIY